MVSTGSSEECVLSNRSSTAQQSLSLIYGPTSPPLVSKTIGALLEDQARQYGERTAVSVPWQSSRLTYKELADHSAVIAKAMLGMGLRHGECLGIMAGNCYQYTEVFLGGARIGCPVVVLNNTYSAVELKFAVSRSACKLVFIASSIGTRKYSSHIETLLESSSTSSQLRRLVYLDDSCYDSRGPECQSYSTFVGNSHSIFISDAALKRAERKVAPSDVVNLQFTSGTTGKPKVAMLTHFNLVNNARFVGHAMRLTEKDVICCPPPLFHCLGLVMGFLSSFCHGSSIVFPSPHFDAQKTIEAVVQEKATALVGVPTMFIAELDALAKLQYPIHTVRTGLAGGAPVPQSLMHRLQRDMHIESLLIAYGMTETSPATFITSLEDNKDKMSSTIGRVMPHTGAKIINELGNITPRGVRGELCTSGFALQKGYWRDVKGTRDAMKTDKAGTLWMHTGDEAFLDEEGYGHIIGRVKDLIIRGGENISPAEIEDRLLAHPTIGECCVIGLEDKKYGEVVGCFLRSALGATKISDTDVRHWVMQTLGRIKAPQYIFWLGDPGSVNDLPKTGSGKYQKHLVREIGNRLVKRLSPKEVL